jgi:hypothetical protein
MQTIILKNMDATRATKVLAKSLYKEFIRNGFTNKDVINFCNELIQNIIQENSDCKQNDTKNVAAC